MKKTRIFLRVVFSILSISFLVGILATHDFASEAQEISLLTVEQASSIAHDHMLRMRNTTIPNWEGAMISPPKVHYDLDNQIAAYVFSVVKDGKDLGYITISSQDLPNPVLEFSTAQARYKTTQLAVRSTVERLGLLIDEQKPLYLGMLAYFYQIGNQESARLIEMNTQQIIPVDVFPASQSQRQSDNLSNPPNIAMTSLPTETSYSSSTSQSISHKLLYGPDYAWYRGCGPTAVANAMGHWADRGYPNLVYGGSGGDYKGAIDQLASLMGTSSEGWTWLPVNDDIKNFAALRGYSFQSSEFYMPSYSTFVGEIDAHRPIVVLVNGHVFYENHFITGFGYEYDPSNPNYRYMIVHDTWGSTPENYWVQYGTGYSKIWFDTVVPPVVQVDTVPPTSGVKPLSMYQTLKTFNVNWSGSDVGWGIKWYDIQYWDSKNNNWTDWITHTTATQAIFTGIRSQTYCFRNRAMDIDYNQESYPQNAESCTTVLPLLTSNYLTGKPGSFFTLSGSEYPSSITVTITINGHNLGVVSTNSTGEFSFLLDTSEADEGGYVVTTKTKNFDLSIFLRLDSNFALRPKEGSGITFSVPSGIALTEFVYLPIVQR